MSANVPFLSNSIDVACSAATVAYMHGCAATGSDVLRELYSELTTMLDARVVAASMYQSNALTLRELQSIQSLRHHPIEAAETLLNIIMEQPDAVYLCFLDVLKRTEQQHVYQRLVETGYKGTQNELLCLLLMKCILPQLNVHSYSWQTSTIWFA